MAHAVGVALDRLAVDAPGRNGLDKRVEPDDGERDPTGARAYEVGLDEECGVLSISQRISSPARKSGPRPKNRVYQSMLASSSVTGTPA